MAEGGTFGWMRCLVAIDGSSKRWRSGARGGWENTGDEERRRGLAARRCSRVNDGWMRLATDKFVVMKRFLP